MANEASELTVRSESIQKAYSGFRTDRYQVNRRYQRKLVWTVEEKRRLIDSVLRDLPIPLFLVAEVITDSKSVLEVIDGMQRLNAIFSFIENEFAVDGEYFDLDALADTKDLLDRGELIQRLPKMARDRSVSIANYSLALSVYRSDVQESVDDVFRRINSGGRSLSKQELRQAGTLSPLADIVRTVASRVRGDTSPSDVLPLGRMPQLSITNQDLDYGVVVDDIFWVKEGILRRNDVRASADEQLVLDILIDCLVDPVLSSGTGTRDKAYDYEPDGEQDIDDLANWLENAIEMYGSDVLVSHFMVAYDLVRSIADRGSEKLSSMLGVTTGGRAPRYFHMLFMAVFELYYREHLRLADINGLVSSLEKGKKAMNLPSGGGDWAASAKRSSIDVAKGVLRPHFEGPVAGDDLGAFSYRSEIEKLLGNAVIEQQMFDSKQGVLRLDADRSVDAGAITKIARALTAMANAGPDAVGYVLMGVADTPEDAERIHALDGRNPYIYRGFHVVGIDREADVRTLPNNEYWAWIVNEVINELPERLQKQVAADARIAALEDLWVGMIKVRGTSEVHFFGDDLLDRDLSSTVVVDKVDYQRIFNRFQ